MNKASRQVLYLALFVVAVVLASPSVVRADPACTQQTFSLSSLPATVRMPPNANGECTIVTITGASLMHTGEMVSSLNSPTDLLTAINGSGGISLCFASGLGDTSVCPLLNSPGTVDHMRLTKNGQWEIGTIDLRLTNGEVLVIKFESNVVTGADHFRISLQPVPEPPTLLLAGAGLILLARKLMA